MVLRWGRERAGAGVARARWRRAPRAAVVLVAGVALCFAFAGCAPPPPPPAVAQGGAVPRMVVTERAPPGGLAYWLIQEEGATSQRLVIWLHPSGGSMNGRAARLAPDLARLGYALLLPIGKQFERWTRREGAALMRATLPDAAAQPGIDGRRPILMGYSAGAQIALLLWAAAPERLGGLALCGGAPLLADGEHLAERVPPPSLGAARTPMLVVVGALEPSAQRWEELGPRWVGAGVRLEMRVVMGEGHDLLFDRQAREDLLRWLAARRGEGQ